MPILADLRMCGRRRYVRGLAAAEPAAAGVSRSDADSVAREQALQRRLGPHASRWACRAAERSRDPGAAGEGYASGSLAASGRRWSGDRGGIPVLVGFAILDPPHVEPRGRVGLAGISGIGYSRANATTTRSFSAVTDTTWVFQLLRSGMGVGVRLPKHFRTGSRPEATFGLC